MTVLSSQALDVTNMHASCIVLLKRCNIGQRLCCVLQYSHLDTRWFDISNKYFVFSLFVTS